MEVNEQTLCALVRGFFDGYYTGLLEARLPEGTPRQPTHLKQLAAATYDSLAATFTQHMLPILLGLRFETLDEAMADLQSRHFTDSTPVKLLLRYACGSRQAYDITTQAYRHQLQAILTGHIQSIPEFFTSLAPKNNSLSSFLFPLSSFLFPLSSKTLLHSLASTVMGAYALGIRHGSGQSLRQPTVFRLMADAAVTLLHDHAIDPWADADTAGLDRVYSRACRTQDNYETLLAEMSQTYENLAAL